MLRTVYIWPDGRADRDFPASCRGLNVHLRRAKRLERAVLRLWRSVARLEPCIPQSLRRHRPLLVRSLSQTGLPMSHSLNVCGRLRSGLLVNNTVFCAGSNAYNQTSAAPRAGSFADISCGAEFSCALSASGSGSIWCWGRNDQSQTDAPAGSFVQIASGVLLCNAFACDCCTS